MSKGHGEIQRRVLAVLAGASSLDSIAVAVAVYGRNPVTLAEVSSVRRAMRKLADKGLVVAMTRHYRDGRRMWALPAAAAAPAERVRATFGERAAAEHSPEMRSG